MVRSALLLLASSVARVHAATSFDLESCDGETCSASFARDAALLQTKAGGKVTKMNDAAELSPSEKDAFLSAHNEYRCQHGSPPLTWNSAMAHSAQLWANGLTSLDHSESYYEAPPAGPAGENLAQGYRSIEGAVGGWYNEVHDCVNFPGCETGRNGAVVGHFTAMIWKGARELGCGINHERFIYVCRYKGDDWLSTNTPNIRGHYGRHVFAAGALPRPDGCDSGSADEGEVSPEPAAPAPTPAPPASSSARPCGSNAASGRSVTLKPGFRHSSNPGSLTDGVKSANAYRTSPRTKSDTCAHQAWVTVDLGQMTWLNQVTLFMYYGDGRRYCGRKVQVSADNSHFTTVVDFGQAYSPTQTASGTVLEFAPVEARYVKVFSSRSSANAGTQFIEVEASCQGASQCCR